MRSIRTSLLLYLSLLLAAAVGVALFFLYENQRERDSRLQAQIATRLKENDERDRELQLKRYEADRKAIENYFNESLRLNAMTLAYNMTQTVGPPRDPRRQALQLMAWHSAITGAGVTTPLAAVGVAGRTVLFEPYHSYTIGYFEPFRARPNIKLFESVAHSRDSQFEFYQVSDKEGVLIRSSALKSDGEISRDFILPTPENAWDRDLLEPMVQDVELGNGMWVRQVAMKVPVTLWKSARPPSRRSGFGMPWDPIYFSPADKEAIDKGWIPVVMFHYARPLAELEGIHQDFKASLEATRQQTEELNAQLLAAQAKDSQQALQTTRLWVLGIGAITILATALLAVGLVHLGLKPVRRITDAVSEINERDFHLKLDEKEVPTELVPIVAKLKQSLKSLGEAFDREKQAAADISHELRTPISALLATSQVCLRKPRSSEEYREALANCADIGQQLNILVERLLTLARLDAGRDPLVLEHVNVPEVAEQCVSMVRPLAESRNLTLAIDRNGPAVLETDPGKLREIVINLLHNAIEYNRPNGSIHVSVSRDNGHVALEVRDTGIGINEEARSHLFERFYRADPSRHADTAHAGLGLAIVKGYVDLMHGRIEVDSVEGEGSTFRVILPAKAG